jgi:3-oxoacyl-[acyl-carrier protein] reductase
MITALKHKEKILEQIPLNRFGNPHEVAGVVVFLLSGESKYITGQVIQIDGGMGI